MNNQARQLIKLEKEVANEREQKNSFQSSLDRTLKELTDIQKEHAESNSIAQSEALEKEIKANEELTIQLEKVKNDTEAMQYGFRKEVQESYFWI